MKFLKLGFIGLLGVVLCSCAQPASKPQAESSESLKVFTVAGVLKEPVTEDESIVVAHDEIPGFMPAMTMPFRVKNREELQGLKAGDSLTFRLSVADETSWIDQITKTASGQVAEPPGRPSIRLVRDVEPLAVGDLIPDYAFTNELGRVVRFSDYRGKALALTFIFTRCPIPEFCPRLSKHFKTVQTQLLARPETPANWHLFSISFDPHYDTPGILKGYARIHGYEPEHWSFVTGSMLDIDAITEQFGPPVVHDGGSLSHKLRAVVIDTEGRITSILMGNQWTADELTAALIQAVAPAPAPSNAKPKAPEEALRLPQ